MIVNFVYCLARCVVGVHGMMNVVIMSSVEGKDRFYPSLPLSCFYCF